MKFLIYGASGFTGKLAVRHAVQRGLTPVLAGRSSDKILPVAQEFNLLARTFDCTAPDLNGIDAVLNCAGPFSVTSRPLVDACLREGIHYLDITGEISVFESIYARHAAAVKAGSVLIPGVGCDVIPTDCLAVLLKRRLPEASLLETGLATSQKASRGTLTTALETFPRGTQERRHGEIISRPHASSYRKIPFLKQSQWAVSVPWGDVASAYRSTGIPNIKTYFAVPPAAILGLIAARPLIPLLAAKFVQKTLRRRLASLPEKRESGEKVYFWGRVSGPSGGEAEMTYEIENPYTFTARAAIESTVRVLSGQIPAGAWTPTQAFGAEFLDALPKR